MKTYETVWIIPLLIKRNKTQQREYLETQLDFLIAPLIHDKNT